MSADDGAICFLLNLLPVAVPPSHAALVGAEQFSLATGWLQDRLPTVFAGLAALDDRVAADVGSDSVDGDTQRTGDFRGGFPLQTHLVDGFDFLLFHG